DFNLSNVIILHESGGSENRFWQAGVSNILLDLPFTLPMIDARVPLGAAHRAVDKGIHTRLLRCRPPLLALQHFAFCAYSPEVLNTINAIQSAGRTFQRGGILQVSLYDFNPLSCQVLGRSTARVASQCPQLPSFGNHVVDDRAALASGC